MRRYLRQMIQPWLKKMIDAHLEERFGVHSVEALGQFHHELHKLSARTRSLELSLGFLEGSPEDSNAAASLPKAMELRLQNIEAKILAANLLLLEEEGDAPKADAFFELIQDLHRN